ncbi:MAG: hypothetical protein L3J86_02700, partial [Thermoplasmata archaeon]|nr:hypothetical protein [Thermoplasmata archaeon]
QRHLDDDGEHPCDHDQRQCDDDGDPVPVSSWAGPWPVDEQWWERATRRRRARFQILLASGEAYLIALERGRFFLEGRYD